MAHKNTVKRIWAILAGMALMISTLCIGGTKTKAYAAEEINGCHYLTENSNYRLYFNEEDLSVVVEDKESGAYMTSAIEYDDGANNDSWLGAMKSAVVITMINGSDDTKQADLINDKVTKTVTKTADGFEASLYWNTYRFGFDLKVSLTEEGLVAYIPDESIKEDSDSYYIGTISIYPYMGNSYNNQKAGYLLVPDGNGALIYLNDKEGRFKSGFSGMIYGNDIGFDESNVQTLLNNKYNTIEDSQKVIAPIFGVAHTDDKIACLGIVEEGAARANIECIPNGASVNYNRAYAKFLLRKTYTQPTSNNSTAGSLHVFESARSHSDLAVRFVFLSGDKANYAGMAEAYRNYLVSRGKLEKAQDSYKTRIDFLGSERENWVLGKSEVVMTRIEDIKEIYSDLEANRVNDIFTVFKGWQKGGLYDLPISSYKVDSKLGSTKELTELIKQCNGEGIEFYLYNEALRINPDENNATFNVVKKINKRRYEEETYKDVYKKMLYLIPSRSDTMLNRFLDSYEKKGITNLALAGISNNLFSYNYSGNNYTRYDTQKAYDELISKVSEESNLVMEQPFAYLWGQTKAFLDMPLYTSSYIFEDESVPFLSLVLKGVMPVYSEYVNFEANKREFFLKMVETGTYPSFYITKESSADLLYSNSSDIYSSEYSSYRRTIAEYNDELKALNSLLEGAVIVAHEIPESDIRVVTYSNGVKVIVNYSNESKTVDNVTVSAMSYEVEK